MRGLLAAYDRHRGRRTVVIAWLTTRVLLFAIFAVAERFMVGDVFYYHRKSDVPPATWHAVEDRTRKHGLDLAGTLLYGPAPGPWLADPSASPRSSGDRAPPSGGGSAGSNPAGGAKQEKRATGWAQL